MCLFTTILRKSLKKGLLGFTAKCKENLVF